MKQISVPLPSPLNINKTYETLDVTVWSELGLCPLPLNSYGRGPGSISLSNVLQSFLLPAKSAQGKEGFLRDTWY